MDIHEKYESLKAELGALGSAAVAYSSGVDSTLLLWAAVEALGRERVLAVTATSRAFPRRERDEAAEFCRDRGIRQAEVNFDALSVAGFRNNPPDRCYHCKRALFSLFLEAAARAGAAALLEGSNADDEGDYRPGMRAVAELGVRSPLRSVGLTKDEIRRLSRELGLPTWDKPSYACLASRVAYGEPITAEKLERVERAEQFLMELGLRQVRVRIHGNLARIELLPVDIAPFMAGDAWTQARDRLKALGFDYVALDLTGYRTGSMNAALQPSDLQQND